MTLTIVTLVVLLASHAVAYLMGGPAAAAWLASSIVVFRLGLAAGRAMEREGETFDRLLTALDAKLELELEEARAAASGACRCHADARARI